MRNFWGSFLGSVIGLILAFVVFAFILVAGISSIFSDFEGDQDNVFLEVKDQTVLHLNWNQALVDRPEENPFAAFNENNSKSGDFFFVLRALEAAAKDEKIVGLYMDMDRMPTGMANMDELLVALENFKASGKFIMAYGETIAQKTYLAMSVADEIGLNPYGDFVMTGLGAEMMFFKGVLDKIGVEPYAIRPQGNKFKSAVEPFLYEQASDANRQQMRALLGSMWQRMGQRIAQRTQMSMPQLDSLISNLSVTQAKEALKYGFIDVLAYEDEFMDKVAAKAGWEDGFSEDAPLLAFHKYASKVQAEWVADRLENPTIAVIYAGGSIVRGKGNSDEIASDDLVETIREVREDDEVKAAVLRVNSPGGDALASEIIWRELSLLKAEKPLIISMGNLAASGGYYISCLGDSIFANPNTITGSIGVFGLLFNAQTMLNDRLGVTTDTVNIHSHANFGSGARPLPEREKEVLQESVDKVYTDFRRRVADGRGLTMEFVDSIGQGRVWTGSMALELGLVDALGGLDDAIACAVRMSSLNDFTIKGFPKKEDPFEAFFESFNVETEAKLAEYGLESTFETLRIIRDAKRMEGVQMRMPYVLNIQ